MFLSFPYYRQVISFRKLKDLLQRYHHCWNVIIQIKWNPKFNISGSTIYVNICITQGLNIEHRKRAHEHMFPWDSESLCSRHHRSIILQRPVWKYDDGKGSLIISYHWLEFVLQCSKNWTEQSIVWLVVKINTSGDYPMIYYQNTC